MDTVDTAVKKKVTRSPNYPAISLREAVEKLGLLYNEMHTHSSTKESIAKLLGYSGINGASNSIISALQKYQLLEEEGSDELKVSQVALDIALYETGSSERIQALETVAFLPATFEDLFNKYQFTLPNDAIVKPYLIKLGFNPNSVTNVIHVYRDTIEFVKEEGAFSENEEKKPPSGNMQNTSEQTLFPQQGIVKNPIVDNKPNATTPSSNLGEGERPLNFRISRHGFVEVKFFGEEEITQEAIDKLIYLLEGSKDVYPTKEELNKPQKAIWKSKDADYPVEVTGVLGEKDGEAYLSIKGSNSGIPASEVEFIEE
jgi:hypothetical protein